VRASLSAQVLARRKELEPLEHLGCTRGPTIGVVATKGAASLAACTPVEVALGIAVGLVLPWARHAAERSAVLAVTQDW
jgi:hypothetical protein